MLKDIKKTPIFVGGTGLYLESLYNNISQIPEISNKIKSKVNEIFLRKGQKFFYEKLLKIDKDYAKKISPNDTQRILRAIEVKVSTGNIFSDWHKKEKKKFLKKSFILFCEWIEIFCTKKLIIDAKICLTGAR